MRAIHSGKRGMRSGQHVIPACNLHNFRYMYKGLKIITALTHNLHFSSATLSKLSYKFS